jgi:hypothetical protein
VAHDVFVSYSKKNKVTADAVCARLEENGVRCWIAPRDVMPGEPWGAAIVRAIGGAKVMVLVLSHAANTSRQIWHEVERAVDKGVTLIPLRIEDVLPSPALEYYISATHWLDALTEPFEAHLDHLVLVVKQILEVPPEKAETTPRPPPSEPPSPTRAAPRRRGGLALLVVALLAAAAAVFALTRNGEGPDPAGASTPGAGETAETPTPESRASATWWLEQAARDRSVFYEDEIASMFWAFAWARACEGERARTEMDAVITKLVGSEAGFIPPGERSDLYTLLGIAFARSGCADETESVLPEVITATDRSELWIRAAVLRHRTADAEGLDRCRAALERETATVTDPCEEAFVRSTWARVLGLVGAHEERDREIEAARAALTAGEGACSSHRLARTIGAVASALMEAQEFPDAEALVAEVTARARLAPERLYGLLAMVGAADAGLERTISLLASAGDLANCPLEAYAALVLLGGFHDDPIPSPTLPLVIGELLRVERFTHAEQLIERIELDATRLPAYCEMAMAVARRDGPAAGRPWMEKAEALLDRVEPGARRDTARAILIRALVATGDRERAGEMAEALVDVPARIAAADEEAEDRYMLLAALATARASLGAWDALEKDLEALPRLGDRMMLHVMVATAILLRDTLLIA